MLQLFGRVSLITGWCAVVPAIAVYLLTLGHQPSNELSHTFFALFFAVFLFAVQSLQLKIENRPPLRWYAALGATLGLWGLLNAIFVLAELGAVYTVATFQARSIAAGLQRAAESFDYLLEQATSTSNVICRADEDGIYFGRFPAIVVPALMVWVANRVTCRSVNRWIRYPLLCVLPVALLIVQAVVADRFPPFTYKCPGFNGYLDVLGQCAGYVFVGTFVLTGLLTAVDLMANEIVLRLKLSRTDGDVPR